ncbi:sel1 repeat family protein [Silanimonas lenta]|uniref:sel1 repeat family protein n=1 Tax=Silanimonas lenta TaxID=265429 RepID=UPI00041F8B45|nr:sel1 repeat family protein [Silanimonas lenta]
MELPAKALLFAALLATPALASMPKAGGPALPETKTSAGDLAADAAALRTDAAKKHKDAVDPWVIASSVFLDGHPDIRYRRYGMDAMRDGAHADAFRHFQRAARFADKPSQAMVAELLWEGRGVERDRALAYAWMEVAAERDYPAFALFREMYWQELTPEERRRAIELNGPLWAEYGDAMAKPRLERRMRTARRQVTGSRVGFVGYLSIEVATPYGSRSIDGSKVYDEVYWDPRRYWAWQDEDWKRLGSGTVEVGTVRQTTATEGNATRDP